MGLAVYEYRYSCCNIYHVGVDRVTQRRLLSHHGGNQCLWFRDRSLGFFVTNPVSIWGGQPLKGVKLLK